jgi:hypothetical protein
LFYSPEYLEGRGIMQWFSISYLRTGFGEIKTLCQKWGDIMANWKIPKSFLSRENWIECLFYSPEYLEGRGIMQWFSISYLRTGFGEIKTLCQKWGDIMANWKIPKSFLSRENWIEALLSAPSLREPARRGFPKEKVGFSIFIINNLPKEANFLVRSPPTIWVVWGGWEKTKIYFNFMLIVLDLFQRIHQTN